MNHLLEVRRLTVSFPGRHRDRPVVREVDLGVEEGETLALVGESGCGKTVTALSLLGLLPAGARIAPGSRIRIDGTEVSGAHRSAGQALRGGTVGMVFQDADSALNPVRRIGSQLREVLARHRGTAPASAGTEVERLLDEVGLPDPSRQAQAFPHQLSGGMRQRVLVALALAGEPRLLVADEPTSALDAVLQVRILDLIRDLTKRRGLGTLLITHDFGAVTRAADRVAVMYAGEVVEEGPARRLLRDPAHPYTRGLLEALPAGGRPKEPLRAMPGRLPLPGEREVGCLFRARCPRAGERCGTSPGWTQVPEGGGRIRCWFPEEGGR